jgi:dolichyl-phosphate beta-glucosyltransferase
MSLSIVIPAYNEAKRLPATLERIRDCFAGVTGSMVLGELIVVDDGSRDGTHAAAGAFAASLPLRVLPMPVNRGKGAAVRTGMLAATGDRVLFYDADGATPPEEILNLGAAMDASGADVAIGSRVNPEQGIVTMSWYRRLIGRVYHALCAPLVPGLQDTACGCKLFTAAAAKDLFSRQTIDRFAFDVEILFLAHRLGYRIEEVRVAWTAVEGSKVRIVRDGVNMFRSVAGLYLAWLKAPPAQRGSAR